MQQFTDRAGAGRPQRACVSDSGKIPWQTDLPGAPGGGVISYLVDGKRRVTFIAGTHTAVLPVTRASAKIVIFGM
jgi:hypothetical protein